jgi:AcrR family transcriptional regulator
MRADAVRNRERILHAASELVERDGVGVPLDDIARHAGVGPGTVHRHFPSKESLFAAIVGERVRGIIALVRGLAADGNDPGGALTNALAAMLAEGQRSVALKAALAASDVDLRTASPDAAAELRAGLDVLVRRAQQSGAIRTDLDTDDVMAVLAGTFAAIRYADADADHATRLASILFAGLRGRE